MNNTQPDAMILLAQLEREARAADSGKSGITTFFYDQVRAEIGAGGRVWFRVNNGPRLYQARAIETLDRIEASEKHRAELIAQGS